MEYEQVEEWLDNLATLQKESNKMHYLNNSVRASLNAEDVLVYEGIEVVADLMGIELKEETMSSEYSFRYRYSFIYNDVTFVDYRGKRLERFAGADRE